MVVGAVTEWNPAHDRDINPVWEFGQVTTGTDDIRAEPGEPYENVPANVRNMRIAVQRYDLYTAQMETAFGTTELEMLARQDRPFKLREFWSTPNGQFDFTYIYYGCWFNNLGRTHSASGDRIVKVAASIMFTRRRKITS